jgi:hypothetical protein
VALGVREIAHVPTNVNEFSQEVNESSRFVRRRLTQLQVDLTVRFIEIAAELTPFRTGHAMANWNASRLAPDLEENFDEPLTVDEISRRARRALRGAKFGDPTYGSNAADYISFLNEGSSTQAAAGFIETAIAIAQDELGVVSAEEGDETPDAAEAA